MKANNNLAPGSPDSSMSGALDTETSNQMDDVDFSFLSELLSQDPNTDVVATPSPSPSGQSTESTASADSAESPGERMPLRKRRLPLFLESVEDDVLMDSTERRKMRSAENARRYRSRKKNELLDLKQQVQHFEEQLKVLRMKRSLLRTDSAVACWEEKAIAQKLKRRHAEEVREQLQQAVFAYTGYVRNLKSVFSESVPPSTALNMQHFLHMYTHLRKDPQLRVQDLGAIGSAAKLDRAMQIVLRETSTMPVSTSPEIQFEELDLGAEGLGKTSTSVYAFNTRDASKAFGVACNAVLTTCGVWPDHSRVESSMKFVDVPPTEFNVMYGITCHTYQHNTTKDRSCTEARDLYYSRMVDSCGVLVWDFVDSDDLYPLRCSTFIKRNTVGALVLRPEVCSDGVERMVCRLICSDMQILVDSPKPSLNVAKFALLEDTMIYESIKEGATDWQDTAVHFEMRNDDSAACMTPANDGALPDLDTELLVPEEMELQAGASVSEPLELSACGLVAHSAGCGQVEDLDMAFLSDLLQTDSSGVETLPASDTSDASPTPDSSSSDAADGSSAEDRGKGASKPKRKAAPALDQEPEPELDDRKARRRAQVANSARRLRCRKKYEMVTLKTEASFLEQQLEKLRSKHKQTRANGAVAAWEEKAIAQRYRRRQAEKVNEQLRHALFLQSGFVRNLRSMFSEAMPCSIELNMRNFLHTPTRLLTDQRSRVRNLERVCTDAKLDMARQIILEETGGINAFTTPHISCQQIDLGRDGFGMTTVAVYALETRNACKTFKATCSAIMNCAAVWPGYSLVTSSLKAAELPPTKLNIRYGMSHNIYQSDATGDRVSVESREISYYRMTEDCGVFLWDYVDADDDNPMQEETTAMRCTIGAVLVRPELCMDGVERIVCRNICTKVHLVESSDLTPTLEQFSKSRQLCARICGSLVYETIKSGTHTDAT